MKINLKLFTYGMFHTERRVKNGYFGKRENHGKPVTLKDWFIQKNVQCSTSPGCQSTCFVSNISLFSFAPSLQDWCS